MKNRREFLRNAATGALMLGAHRSINVAALADERPQTNQHGNAGKSKVVIARDPGVHGTDSQPNEKRVLDLLDRAIAHYTGRDNQVDAWKHILGSSVGPDKVIGLKTNGLGGKGICTHQALILAVAERLQQTGVKAGNILVWDRNRRDLEVTGMTINTDRSRIRCYGSDVAGFDEKPSTWGSATISLSKILSQECDMVIGLPILKDHSIAGVTFAMKNMYGVVDKPFLLHGTGCNPAVADLNCIPAIRQKVRFTIGDALSSVYDGGPGFHPEHLWYPNALIVGEDRVAVDHTAWQMLERKRAESGISTFEAAGRAPHYIATAADAPHALGTNDPSRMNVMEV